MKSLYMKRNKQNCVEKQEVIMQFAALNDIFAFQISYSKKKHMFELQKNYHCEHMRKI